MQVYYIINSQLESYILQDLDDFNLLHEAIWIDINIEEKENIKKLEDTLNFKILPCDYSKPKLLSKSFEEKNGRLLMTSVFFLQKNKNVVNSIDFIVDKNKLITIRDNNNTLFSKDILNFKNLNLSKAHIEILLAIIKKSLHEILEKLELEDTNLDLLSNYIITHGYNKIISSNKEVLKKLSIANSAMYNLQESLVSLKLIVRFMLQSNLLNYDINDSSTIVYRLKVILDDIASLVERINCLTNKITFLLDATLGLINIEQNISIKMLSIISVIFIPPTLIATIYGMNFKNMPELSWRYGYIFSIILMFLSSAIFALYCKKKKLW